MNANGANQYGGPHTKKDHPGLECKWYTQKDGKLRCRSLDRAREAKKKARGRKIATIRDTGTL